MPTSEPGAQADALIPALRRITASVGVSSLGTWSYNVGIAVYAYQETRSTTWVAVATVGRYVPALFITALGSRVADRFPRRRVAVTCDLVCAAAMAALTIIALAHAPLALAVAVAAVSSGVARVQSSAALSVAADLAPESQLARGAVLMSTAESVGTALGPAIASAVLLVLPPQALFALNGVTFLVSAALLLTVAAPSALPRAWAAGRAQSDDATYRAVVRAVWPLLATRTVTAVVYGVDIVLLAVVATEQLRQGTTGYGWLLAAAGTGGLVAAVSLRRGTSLSSLTVPSVAGVTLYAVPLLVFVVEPALGAGLAAQLVRGFGFVLVSAAVIAGLQRSVPGEVSTRVFGLTHVWVLVGTSVGAVSAPLLLSALGLTRTLVVMAVLPLLVQLVLAPALARFDREGASAVAALDPRVDALRQLALFRDASRSTLYDVAARATEEVVDGLVLVREGDGAEDLFVLREGAVEVSQLGPDGPRLLRRMEAPAYFGEIGLLHGVARTATVTAVGTVTVWRVPGAVFLGAVSQAGLSGALTDSVRTRIGTSAESLRALTADG